MSQEDEEFMLDNFVTFFIAGESALFLRQLKKNKKLGFSFQVSVLLYELQTVKTVTSLCCVSAIYI